MPHPCHRVRLALLLAWPAERAAVAAANVVTPIGPFCPFRSAVCAENGPLGAAMSDLTSSKMPVFAAEMSRLQLEMSMGNEPDPKRVGALADDLIEAEQQWQRILTRMRLADDFQSREYFKVTAAWAIRQGQSLEAVGLMMRWQAENMKSFATGGNPLPPPPGVDLTQIAQQQQQGGGQSNMMAQMASASATPASRKEHVRKRLPAPFSFAGRKGCEGEAWACTPSPACRCSRRDAVHRQGGGLRVAGRRRGV